MHLPLKPLQILQRHRLMSLLALDKLKDQQTRFPSTTESSTKDLFNILFSSHPTGILPFFCRQIIKLTEILMELDHVCLK